MKLITLDEVYRCFEWYKIELEKKENSELKFYKILTLGKDYNSFFIYCDGVKKMGYRII